MSIQGTAAVSGRVTLKGEPARNATIVLQTQISRTPPDPEAVLRARTDGDGRYHIAGVAPGRYSIRAFAPGAITADDMNFGGPPGKTLYLSEGENVENIDFELKLGGVITGRVTDSHGRPLVDERVTVSSLDRSGRLRQFIGSPFSGIMYVTDDRGVYRIYGLPEGKYRISVGNPKSLGLSDIIQSGAFYPQTFHPDTTDESQAKVIEVTEGVEAANIDISVGEAMKTYNVYGRLAHAESGQAVPGVGISYGSFSEGRIVSSVSNGESSGANGEFHLVGILPGKYGVFTNSQGDNDYVGDPVIFEICDSDVHSVEVKVRQGGSISGVVVIEGATDLKTPPQLSQNNLYIFAQSIHGPQPHGGVRRLTRVNADGTFHLRGLQEGIVGISIAIAHGVALTRVELNGALQDNGIEIAPGKHITGVKVFVTRATLSLRGEVKIVGKTLAPEQRLITSARLMDYAINHQSSAHVDPRGKFVIENLAPGEYEVGINLLPNPNSGRPDFQLMRAFSMIKQRVNITGDDQPPITLVIDMSRIEREPMRQPFSNMGSAICGVSGGIVVSNPQRGTQPGARGGTISGQVGNPYTGRESESQTGAPTGTITGRVVYEDGVGAPNIIVSLTSLRANQPPAAARSHLDRAITDKEGNFKFTCLAPGVYMINVLGTKEYVRASSPPAESRKQKYSRVGDHVSITLIRGGVITGRVATANGEPMVGVRVNPVRVRDEVGFPVCQQSGVSMRITDDRGVYRLYGLAPGTYVIYTRPEYFGPSVSPYEGGAPTYHPSDTGDTATEIAVTSGGEAPGVDIRYRGEHGQVVSGSVSSSTEHPSLSHNVWVTLTCLSTGNIMSGRWGRPGENVDAFAIYDVPDGEYEIIARSMDINSAESFASAPRRVTVRGADLTGIELTLLPMASISGRLVLEATQTARVNRREFTLEEVMISVRRNAEVGAAADPCGLFQYDVSANDKGEFSINNIQPARYFIETGLPDEYWFVKSTAASAPQGEAIAGAVSKNTASTAIARDSINLKPGEKLTGLTLVIADGAASLRGKVVAEKEGVRLPSRMRVHLAPAESTASDDVFRYAETVARGDGSFALNPIAPGKYLLVVRAVPDDEPIDMPPPPVAWDADERTKLRREALAAKNEIELKPYQRVEDYVLLFSL